MTKPKDEYSGIDTINIITLERLKQAKQQEYSQVMNNLHPLSSKQMGQVSYKLSLVYCQVTNIVRPYR